MGRHQCHDVSQQIEIFVSEALRKPKWLDALLAQSRVADQREGANASLEGSVEKALPELLRADFPDQRISASLDGYDVILAIVERPIFYENTRRVGQVPDDHLRLTVVKF
jgi:hypothetical protein